MTRSRFCKVVARAGIQIEPIEFFQILDALETLGAKGTFAVERVEHDPFQEIAERQVVKLPERFEHFQDSLLHANAGLHALHRELSFIIHSAIPLIGTNVPKYPGHVKRPAKTPWASHPTKNHTSNEPSIHIAVIKCERMRW